MRLSYKSSGVYLFVSCAVVVVTTPAPVPFSWTRRPAVEGVLCCFVSSTYAYLLRQFNICLFASSVQHMLICFVSSTYAYLLRQFNICLFASSVQHMLICFVSSTYAVLLCQFNLCCVFCCFISSGVKTTKQL